jgi:hypothetical protein
MHLFIPHASALGQAAEPAIRHLDLPRLAELLALLVPDPETTPAASTTTGSGPSDPKTAAIGGDDDELEYRLSPPHEAALARLAGWPGRDGNWPVAAWCAARDGVVIDGAGAPDAGLGLITPVHWRIGQEITLTDPLQLELNDAESHALFDAVCPAFDDLGWRLYWGSALRWYAAAPILRGQACASLDRVVGRNVDLWLPRGADARLLRRLQVEVQMTWHEHPVNEAREARGLPAVNSFWLSGCGVPSAAPLPAGLRLDERLGAPLLAGDWASWCQAWQTLDAGPVTELLSQARAGSAVTLTLCGERLARSWRTPLVSPSLWQRTRRHMGSWLGATVPDARSVLSQL